MTRGTLIFTGKAALFQDDEVVKNKKQLSKTCLIQ